VVKLKRPVMGVEEAEAAVLGLKALVKLNMVAQQDEDKLRHVIEAIETAPVLDGDKVEVDVAARKLGPFAAKSETSRQAALVNYPKSGTQRARILRTIVQGADGRTREELASLLGLPDNSVRPRVRELIDGGWIVVHVRDGEAVTRKTALGNQSEVLIPTAKARARAGAAARTSAAPQRRPVTA
jgi:hypothetical protein